MRYATHYLWCGRSLNSNDIADVPVGQFAGLSKLEIL